MIFDKCGDLRGQHSSTVHAVVFIYFPANDSMNPDVF